MITCLCSIGELRLRVASWKLGVGVGGGRAIGGGGGGEREGPSKIPVAKKRVMGMWRVGSFWREVQAQLAFVANKDH